MSKCLFISEKPSVAQEFAKALGWNFRKQDGYLEAEEGVVTWCVGHLVTMSYPEVYDPALKKWSLETLPFLPKVYKYEIIPQVNKQFQTVKMLLNREDIGKIYVCTDSGREGEYIYRLVDEMSGVGPDKEKLRVWIDSQTEEEILRGIKEAKKLSDYDHLSDAAYLRAKEDYLMGINFSRVLTLKYGQNVTGYLQNGKWTAISVGRVMTCVLGMVVRREREIRNFTETSFYRILAALAVGTGTLEAEWRAVPGSAYYLGADHSSNKAAEKTAEKITDKINDKTTENSGEKVSVKASEKASESGAKTAEDVNSEEAAAHLSPLLYKENGFLKEEDAKKLIGILEQNGPAIVEKMEKKKENKNAPLLYNLAELQNDCSRLFKISPDQTLQIVQELYEKKLVTYPRTDARVLSTAAAKEIHKNLGGLCSYMLLGTQAKAILSGKAYQNIAKTRYTNDKLITDHYAIIPTGQGLGALASVSGVGPKVYELIVRRFLCIFLPPAVYQKISLICYVETAQQLQENGMPAKEHFFAGFKLLIDAGYLRVAQPSGRDKQQGQSGTDKDNRETAEEAVDTALVDAVSKLKKGMQLPVKGYSIKEGKTSPPKRYNSGSMILAMENAGQLIEDEELRAHIKGSGIGTSATRAEILNKLVKISYLNLNTKTQMVTPTRLGEMIFEVVQASIRPLLNPELTASWEKGLTYVAEGSITKEEYMKKLESFISRNTDGVKNLGNQGVLRNLFDQISGYYA